MYVCQWNSDPPAVLFPGVRFNLEYSIGSPQNFYLGFTQNGWMDTKQFYAWIANHFVKKIPPLRPIVLLIDRHGSHINYYVSQFCAEDQILLFRFPRHRSRAVQPTDREFFGAKPTVQYPGISITKRQFRFIFTRAYEISCKVETVKSSFRATGI